MAVFQPKFALRRDFSATTLHRGSFSAEPAGLTHSPSEGNLMASLSTVAARNVHCRGIGLLVVAMIFCGTLGWQRQAVAQLQQGGLQQGGLQGGGLQQGGLQGGGLQQGGQQGGGLQQGGGNNGNQAGGSGVVVDPQGVLRVLAMPDANLSRVRRRAAAAAMPGDLRQPSKFRKVALSRLEAALVQAIESGEPLPDSLKNLAGLTRIQYVFIYPATAEQPGDVVLAGPAEPWVDDAFGRPVGVETATPVVQLEDLAAVLRAFPPGQPADLLVGCSIDPTQEGLANMQAYLKNVGLVNPQGTQAEIVSGLREALGPQVVTIDGISPSTHYAQVLVEADYRMKLIGIGLEKPPVRMSTWIDLTSAGSVAANALQRWYFTPNYECLRVTEDDLGIELVGEGVKLLGADEMVMPDGRRMSSQSSSRASKLFTQAFTLKYEQIASRHPVYAQLKTLIDLAIVAAYLQEHDAFGRTNWSADILRDESSYAIEQYTPPRQIDCAVNAVRKGNRLLTPIGGGVVMTPRRALDAANLQADEQGTVAATKSELTIPADRWWWD